MSPVQVRASVLRNEAAGAYRRLVLAAPGAADDARPGQFVALAVGDAPTAMLLRRSFSLHAAGHDERGVPTVEVVVAAHGPGSDWVTRRRPGDPVDLVGPLGRPFPAPAGSGACVLVGGGYGSAPLLWWARELAAAGRAVHVVLGAATRDRLFGEAEAIAAGATVHVTTDDGSAGTRGRVTDVLGPLLTGPVGSVDAVGPGGPGDGVDVYACGPMAMLRAVAAAGAVAGATVWCAVEESMACGIGVCMTCVLPVRHADGVTRMTRSCTDGPTFAGDAVRWDAVVTGPHGTASLVPADCLGAPALTPGAH